MSEKDLATTLREEAALAEKEFDSDDDVWVRSRRPPKSPSMVYSVRIPVSRVEELRQVAADAGLDPSAMVRQWVLERLDSELSDEGRAVEQMKGALEGLLKAFKTEDGSSWGMLLTPDIESLFAVLPAPSRVASKRAWKRSEKAGGANTGSSASRVVAKAGSASKTTKATRTAKAATAAKAVKTGAAKTPAKPTRRISRG